MKRRKTIPAPKAKARFKKGDVVYVRSGDSRGTHGKYLQVMPRTGKVLVEGVNLVKKHMRKSQEHPQGGVIEKEAPLPACVLVPHRAGSAKSAGK